jgi:signal peptidase I
MTSEPEQVPESEFKSPRRARLERGGRELVLWLRTLTSAAIYATVIMTFGFQVARVEGRSMEPTLEDQDRLVVNKLAYHLHDPQVGDIVMLLHPANPRQTLVKRVVAEPGDTVAFRDGHVLRNGAIAAEDFIPAVLRSHETLGAVVVPEGYYFVLGDHRNDSSDSRVFGPVPMKYILGRIQVRWWPFASARHFEP